MVSSVESIKKHRHRIVRMFDQGWYFVQNMPSGPLDNTYIRYSEFGFDTHSLGPRMCVFDQAPLSLTGTLWRPPQLLVTLSAKNGSSTASLPLQVTFRYHNANNSEAWQNGEPVPPNVTQKWFLLEDDFFDHPVDENIPQHRVEKYIREHADTSRRLP
ncbi:hypothetical protein FCOIX_2290 [Fusarium coicis]|nr:hypothetical protein FCOIX_2290 [Fusarium coicis]